MPVTLTAQVTAKKEIQPAATFAALHFVLPYLLVKMI